MVWVPKSPIAVVASICLLAASAAWWGGHVGQIPFAASSPPSLAQLAGLQLPFIANHGQADPRVAYYASTFAGTVFVNRDGTLVYSLPAKSRRGLLPATGKDETANVSGGWTLTETFVNGNPRPVAGDVAPANVSYFIGNDPKGWRPHVSSHARVALGEVWSGIAVHVEAHGHNVEKLFTIAPGADVSAIRMRVDGATRLSITDDGALVLGTGLGVVTLTAPIAWQEKDGERTPVAVAYVLRNEEYGFSLGARNPELPVVIDPLLQSTYLGGSGSDAPAAIALHPTTGEVYVAGETSSTTFPGTTGGAQSIFAGGVRDAFIARLSTDLTTLLQATYLGGATSDERVQSIFIHPGTGEAYVTGVSYSTDFPGTLGGAQPAFAGGLSDAFVARLSGDLTVLNQATYLGGARDDAGRSVALYPVSGEIYIAGNTNSIDFPATAGGAQPTNSAPALGNAEIFVARLNPALTAINQSTYYGSFGTEEMSNSLAIHPTTGEVYVAGQTQLSAALPGTAGGAQPASGGSQDMFVVRFGAALTTLGQATYLGGSGIEGIDTYVAGDGIGRSLIIHPGTGEIYVSGFTESANFPGTAGGAQAALRGTRDGFITRLDAGLTTLNQSTYVGGFNSDNVSSLALHSLNGEIYAAGTTAFSAFPETAGGAQATYGGGTNDGFVARFNAGLTTLNQATYLGGSGVDIGGAGLVIHASSGEVYVTTRTASTDFPVTAGGAQPANGGGLDGSVTRITADLQSVALTADLALTKTDTPDPVTVGASLAYTITATNNGPAAATGVTVTDALPASATFVSATPSQGSCSGTTTVTCNLGGLANGASATITILVTPTATGALSNTATVTAVETDSNAANNSATTTSTVIAASADLAVTVSATPNPVGVNATLSYAVQATNNGPSNATGVTLTSALTGGSFTFGSIAPSQGSCVGTTAATCSLGPLANGASATVTVVVTPTAVGTLTLSAAVTATEPDANAANNNALLAVNAVNTLCSNVVQGFVANVFGPQAAGCSVTVGSSSAGGGGGSVEFATLSLLLLLALGRRIAPVRVRLRGSTV